jgi:hypothetical protein
LAADLFKVLPNKERLSDDLKEAGFQLIETMMKKFRGHQRCTNRVVSKHRGGQDSRYDDPKKRREEKVDRITT